MLLKTHKAFAVTTTAIVAIAYFKYTGRYLTGDLVVELASPIPSDRVQDLDYKLSTLRDYLPFVVQYLILILASVMGSEFPDLDHGIKDIKHRGWTHTIYPIIISGLLTYHLAYHHTYFGGIVLDMVLPIIVCGFTIGYFSHLLADDFSLQGINWFNPSKNKKDYDGENKTSKQSNAKNKTNKQPNTKDKKKKYPKKFGIIPRYKVGSGFMGATEYWIIAIILSIYYLVYM